jgi:antitoxin component YwqK of YwqJK toxin-antitoxin module
MLPKTINHLALVMLCFLLAGCSKELPKDKTHVKAGLVYEIGKKKPFTGYVVGKSREDYRRKALKYKKQYKDGLLNGETRFWYDNGQIESKEPYRNGKINGVAIRYHENSQVKAYIHMVDGMRGGYKGEKVWSEDGKRIK